MTGVVGLTIGSARLCPCASWRIINLPPIGLQPWPYMATYRRFQNAFVCISVKRATMRWPLEGVSGHTACPATHSDQLFRRHTDDDAPTGFSTRRQWWFAGSFAPS